MGRVDRRQRVAHRLATGRLPGARRLFPTLLLALVACAPARGAVRQVAVGPAIPIAGVLDLQGPTRAAAGSYADGIRDYVAWRNAHGGASGRLVELRLHDSDGQDQVAAAVTRGSVAILGWGLGPTPAVRQAAAAGDVPFLPASGEEALALPTEHASSFVVGPTSATQLRAALTWIARDAAGHADVTFLHADSDFGRSPIQDGRQFIARQNLDLGFDARPDTQPAPPADPASPAPRYLVIHDLPEAAARILTTTLPSNVKVLCLAWCADERLIGLAPAATEGVLGVQPVAPIASDPPGQHEPGRFLAAQGRRVEDRDLHYLQGWYTAHVVAEALAKVVESRDDVNPATVRRALEVVGPIRTGVGAPIHFTAGRHEGTDTSGIYQVIGGIWRQVGTYPMPLPTPPRP